MLPRPLDRLAEFPQPAAQYVRGIVARPIQDAANVPEREARVAIRADLPQPVDILRTVNPVMGRAPARRLQQSDRFVVQHRAARQITTPREPCDGERHDSSLNPEAIDRSSPNYGGVSGCRLLVETQVGQTIALSWSVGMGLRVREI